MSPNRDPYAPYEEFRRPGPKPRPWLRPILEKVMKDVHPKTIAELLNEAAPDPPAYTNLAEAEQTAWGQMAALANQIPAPSPMPNVGNPADMARRFDLHRPATKADGVRCDHIRAAIKSAAQAVAAWAPANREQALALTKLEEALYFAVAAVVRPPA